MSARFYEGADLFCGAGGTSEGMMRAAAELQGTLNLLAVNHWPVAINSHSLNHPTVRHKCESLDTVKPRAVVPGGHLHILAASPECTHHSVAAGGRPRNDQSRATAWHVCRWASDLRIDNIFIENVREFQDWGPLDQRGKPIKSRKGETFRAFVQALESMNYRVEYRVQCAAQFGDPTSRKRLIVLARRNGRPIVWPKPSHGEGRRPYRTAREIIDWDLKGQSIFNRKRPLSKNTMRRIAAGLRKFGGENAKAFLIKLYGTAETADVDAPLPTVTAGGNHLGLVEPFLIPRNAGQGRQDKRAHSVDEPLRTLTCTDTFALVEPFLVHSNHEGGDRCHSLHEPLPTVTGGHRGEMALVQPFIVGLTHTKREDNSHSVDEPVPTLTTAKRGEYALVQPFLTKYYGTGIAKSVDEPLDTVTTKDRFVLVEPQSMTGHRVDITLRMLQPHELQAAMSFPRNYKFYGTREQQVKQIGNAVPVELAKAHTLTLLNDQ
jgi:DNA (cytosine-5)-methyltransferase 1